MHVSINKQKPSNWIHFIEAAQFPYETQFQPEGSVPFVTWQETLQNMLHDKPHAHKRLLEIL